MLSIDLSGPQGNAYYILGAVDKALKDNGCAQAERDEYHKLATSGDYVALLETTKETLDKHHIEYDIDYDTNKEDVY